MSRPSEPEHVKIDSADEEGLENDLA